MLIFSLLLAITLFAAVSGVGWHSGTTVNTVLGIAAGPGVNQVWATGYANGQGGILWYSDNTANAGGNFVFPVGGINLAVAVSSDGNTVAVAGPSGIFYGPATSAFTSSSVSGSWTSVVTQNIRPLGTSGFAVVGRFHNEESTLNGVAYSSSASGTWTTSSIGLDTNSGYYARYGSFPTATTWYVTSGNWPNDSDEKLTGGITERVSARLGVTFNAGNDVPFIQYYSARHLLGTYPGAISKTTNGGATWTKVYDSNGQYVFNQIDCFDANTCFAAAENGKAAVVVKTTDGGSSWSTVISLTGPKSLHAVRMLSDSEIWVSGGEPSSGPYTTKEIVGDYYHSTDGGTTWTEISYNGYGYDLSFVDSQHAYATALFKQHSDVWIYE